MCKMQIMESLNITIRFTYTHTHTHTHTHARARAHIVNIKVSKFDVMAGKASTGVNDNWFGYLSDLKLGRVD